jgi:hypothetical protein
MGTDDDGQYIRSRPESKPPTKVEYQAPPTTAINELVPTRLPAAMPTTVAPASDVPLSAHLFTSHTDSIEHPHSTITEVLANRTFPNKFRIKARVKDIYTRGPSSKDAYVQKHCGHCRRA